MKISLDEARRCLPLPATEKWPEGVPFTRMLAHGTMSVELFAPRGTDHQTPHEQDELYVVISGTGELVVEGEVFPFAPGDVLFVPAGREHRFERFSDDFATWVVFWGPEGGEAP